MNAADNASVVGIDFGTTNTAVYEITRNNGVIKERIFGEGGEFPFPSLMAVTSDNKLCIGTDVKKNLEKEDYLQTHTTVSSLKSLLGTDRMTMINGREYSPADLTANYLKAILKYIQKKYNVDIKEAVLSYPVDFSPAAREDLCKAADKAEISILNMVTESTGAYLAVRDKLRGFSNVMVIDWGGGTFDISILSVNDGKLEEKSVYGVKVGGDNVDMALAKYVHSKIIRMSNAQQHISFEEMSADCRQKMIAMCERAKIQISESGDDFLFTLLKYGIYGTKTVEVTLHELNEIVKPIISSKIIPAINAALQRAQISALGIDKVVIAGGSSNLAPYANAITGIFGYDKILTPDKERFISAKGAALMPLIKGGYKLNDDVGILMSDKTVFPILKRGEDSIGSHSNTVTFSLVEDSSDAHFIITNSDGTVIYNKISVPTKGFMRENIEVSADVTSYQTVKLHFHNDSMTDSLKDTEVQINKLTFYYDLNNI